jgi:hypothetical protein
MTPVVSCRMLLRAGLFKSGATDLPTSHGRVIEA